MIQEQALAHFLTGAERATDNQIRIMLKNLQRVLARNGRPLVTGDDGHLERASDQTIKAAIDALTDRLTPNPAPSAALYPWEKGWL